eukprot:jgi/Bigna1/58578/fgenesh1_pm.115_\
MAPRSQKKRVIFLHPDLGLGGAETLIVKAAQALKEKGHNVTIYTSYYNPERCIQASKELDVRVAGDWIPRKFLGQFHIVFALLRAFWLSLFVAFWHSPDVWITDQIAAYNLVLWALSSKPIVFYCHFPDQLLTQRKTLLKRLYRLPFDLLEQSGTAAADTILVNSAFTANVFKATFRFLGGRQLQILYPSVSIPTQHSLMTAGASVGKDLKGTIIFLSINRFERKKNLALAIHAFSEFLKLLAAERESNAGLKGNKTSHEMADERKTAPPAKLILAGGYDVRVQENVEYFAELEKLAYEEYKFSKKQVEFIRSFEDAKKRELLVNASCVLYTPENEHFGIVPIEAMAHGTPVIASDSGGPKESIESNVTGFLCKHDSVSQWARRLLSFAENQNVAKKMGRAGRSRVEKMFSFKSFQKQLHDTILAAKARRGLLARLILGSVCVVLVGMLILMCFSGN